MTMEPASTRANRINSDSMDWSYIGISLTVGHPTSVRRARRRPTALSPYSWALRGSLCGSDVDGRGRGARVHLGGPRHGLRVDVLPNVRHLAASNGDGEDPIVLERPIRRCDFPRRGADHQNPI